MVSRVRQLLALYRVLERGAYAQALEGPEQRAFEQEFSDVCCGAHVVGTASGTDALMLAVKAVGVAPGDEVIVPAYGFIATASVVSWVGATPVFVDVDRYTYTLRPESVAEAITENTRAVIATHLFGATADVPNILSQVAHRPISVIEDATQSLGATRSGSPAGLLGDIGCFSFSPLKALSAAGNAGAIATWNAGVADTCRLQRSYGARRHFYDYPCVGINNSMQELQAAIAREELPHRDKYVSRRTQIAKWYRMHLGGIRGLGLPVEQEGRVYHRFVVEHAQRDSVVQYLRKMLPERLASAVGVHYRRTLPELEAFQRGEDRIAPEHAATISSRVLSLPLKRDMREQDVALVGQCLRRYEGRDS